MAPNHALAGGRVGAQSRYHDLTTRNGRTAHSAPELVFPREDVDSSVIVSRAAGYVLRYMIFLA